MLSTNATGAFSKGVDLIIAQELEVLENPHGLCVYTANLGYYHQSPFENGTKRIQAVIPDKGRLIFIGPCIIVITEE